MGTDRSTGDALGPLVGTILKQKKVPALHIYGTLDEPVHALNLAKTVTAIHLDHHHPFIIAIDACLGKYEHVGQISVGHGPLKPGAAVQKNLPAVGDMHITGIVNVGGFMEYFVLQNTRLSIVMQMATKIPMPSTWPAVLSINSLPNTPFRSLHRPLCLKIKKPADQLQADKPALISCKASISRSTSFSWLK